MVKEKSAPDVLDDDNTDHMEDVLKKLEEEVDGIDYKNAELKEELNERVKYSDERVKLLQERIVFHQDQRARAAVALAKLGVFVEGAPAATTTPEDGMNGDVAAPTKKKAKGSGSPRGPKGDNKYTIKEAVERVVKAEVPGLTVEEISQRVQMPEESGGAGYKTDADADAFKTAVANTGVRPLIQSGALIADPSAGRTKRYIHRENVDKLM